jgi:hypothetical protein
MTLERIDDHLEQAADLLLDQYKEKPRLYALLASYVRRCQELETATWDVIWNRLIDYAADGQLDTLGAIVGEKRLGKSDATYRVYIRARIRINYSEGHPDDIIDVQRLVESTPFVYREYYPATVVLEYLDDPVTDPHVLRDLAIQTKAAGVRITVIAGSTTNFCFGHEGAVSDDDARSFGEEGTDLYGGPLGSEYI